MATSPQQSLQDGTTSSKKVYDKPQQSGAYRCQFCPHRTQRKQELKSHELHHSANLPSQCAFCTFSSKDPNSLGCHINRVHPDEKKKLQDNNNTLATEKVEQAQPRNEQPRSRETSGNDETRHRHQGPINPSPNKDSLDDEEADEPSQEEDEEEEEYEEEEKFHLIMAAHLESNEELMEALTRAKYLHIHTYDYKFLDDWCKYQPDFLISSRTALIIVDEELDGFEDTRLRILNASFKCLVCFVIVLSPRVFKTKKMPEMWSSLVGLSRFYETMDHTDENAPGFQLYLRLVTNYDQIATVILDTVRTEQYRDIENHLQPITFDVQPLLHFRQFNAVSAQRVLQYITLEELVSLPVLQIWALILSKHLRRIIKLFLERTGPEIVYDQPFFKKFLVTSTVDRVQEDSDFGVLKCTTTKEPEETFAFLQSPSKKARRDAQRKTLEDSSHITSPAELMYLWNSPTVKR